MVRPGDPRQTSARSAWARGGGDRHNTSGACRAAQKAPGPYPEARIQAAASTPGAADCSRRGCLHAGGTSACSGRIRLPDMHSVASRSTSTSVLPVGCNAASICLALTQVSRVAMRLACSLLFKNRHCASAAVALLISCSSLQFAVSAEIERRARSIGPDTINPEPQLTMTNHQDRAKGRSRAAHRIRPPSMPGIRQPSTLPEAPRRAHAAAQCQRVSMPPFSTAA